MEIRSYSGSRRDLNQTQGKTYLQLIQGRGVKWTRASSERYEAWMPWSGIYPPHTL